MPRIRFFGQNRILIPGPPPPKKNTLRVKVGWPVYDPIFSFFSLEDVYGFMQTDLLFNLGTPVHGSAAAVRWVFGSGAGLLLLAWNVEYSPPGIIVV